MKINNNWLLSTFIISIILNVICVLVLSSDRLFFCDTQILINEKEFLNALEKQQTFFIGIVGALSVIVAFVSLFSLFKTWSDRGVENDLKDTIENANNKIIEFEKQFKIIKERSQIIKISNDSYRLTNGYLKLTYNKNGNTIFVSNPNEYLEYIVSDIKDYFSPLKDIDKENIEGLEHAIHEYISGIVQYGNKYFQFELSFNTSTNEVIKTAFIVLKTIFDTQTYNVIKRSFIDSLNTQPNAQQLNIKIDI